MRIRAGVLLFSGNSVAMIRRVKQGRTYYVVPGGGLHDGETTETAAKREALEELGLHVGLERLLAIVERIERQSFTHVQFYYLATILSGTFGSGGGEEYARSARHGLYQPTWLPLDTAWRQRVYPKVVLDYLANSGVPNHTVHLLETTDFPH